MLTLVFPSCVRLCLEGFTSWYQDLSTSGDSRSASSATFSCTSLVYEGKTHHLLIVVVQWLLVLIMELPFVSLVQCRVARSATAFCSTASTLTGRRLVTHAGEDAEHGFIRKARSSARFIEERDPTFNFTQVGTMLARPTRTIHRAGFFFSSRSQKSFHS